MIAQEALARSKPCPDGRRKAVAVDGRKWFATSNPHTGRVDYSVGGWASYLENVDLERDHPADGWEPLHPEAVDGSIGELAPGGANTDRAGAAR